MELEKSPVKIPLEKFLHLPFSGNREPSRSVFCIIGQTFHTIPSPRPPPGFT